MTRPPVSRRELVILFLGCVFALGLAFAVLRGSSVTILTGSGGIPGNTEGSPSQGCYTSSIGGEPVTDPTYGTAVIQHYGDGSTPDQRFPVMWLPGDTGRKSGSEVEILDRSGSVIARTGQAWFIEGGFYSVDNVRVWVACGFVQSESASQ